MTFIHGGRGRLFHLVVRCVGESWHGVYLHSISADARAAVQEVEDLVMGLNLTQVVESSKPEAR